MDGKKGFFDKGKEWVKEHKTEIIVVSSIAIFAFGAIWIVKDWDIVKELKLSSRFKNGALPKGNATQITPEVVSTPINDVSPFISVAVQSVATDISVNEKTIDVSRHVRNLHKGCKASPEKRASALENGIILEENQTWVNDYRKSCA